MRSNAADQDSDGIDSSGTVSRVRGETSPAARSDRPVVEPATVPGKTTGLTAARTIEGRVVMLSIAPILFDARVQKQARALRDAGYRVRIICLADPASETGTPAAEWAWERYRTSMAGIETQRVFLRSREWLRVPKKLRKLLMAGELLVRFTSAVIRSPADLVHCHDLAPGIFALWSKLLHGARLVYDAHELEVRSPSGWRRRLQAAYERLVIRVSDAALAVNPEIAKIMKGAYGKPVHVIANRPPFVADEQLDRSRLRKSIGRSGSTKLVLYAGYVQAGDRGIEEMVRALAHLEEDYLFLIMGVGRLDEFRRYLDNHLRELGIAPDRVCFIGPYPPEEVIPYLAGADVSLALYQRQRTENNSINAPNKLFNSIMARTPVLASDNETLPRWVVHNGVGPLGEVVDERDPVAIARTIRLMLDPARQREYRRNAEIVARQISWENEADALLAVYSSVRRREEALAIGSSSL